MESYDLTNKKFARQENIIKIALLYILINLTVIQQMPIIKDYYYNKIRFLLYLGFGITSFYSIFSLSQFIKYKLVKYYVLCIIYLILLFIVANLFGVIQAINAVFELLIPFGILLCSLNIKLKKRQLKNILITYAILSAILGCSSIFYYGQGFIILRSYFLTGKNQIGPLLGISAIIMIYSLFGIDSTTNRKRKKSAIIADIILFFIIISSMIVIRNRSGLVAIALVSILIVLGQSKGKLNLKNVIVVQLVLLLLILLMITGVFGKMLQIIKEAFISNYDVTDLNSISAGRIVVYKNAIMYICNNPILGELSALYKFNEIPHNYILNKWVRYGMMGSLPIVVFYLYIWKFDLKSLKKSRKRKEENTLALWVLLFSLIVSFFEYTYPFGPGVSQIMVWFLLGQYLKK